MLGASGHPGSSGGLCPALEEKDRSGSWNIRHVAWHQ